MWRKKFDTFIKYISHQGIPSAPLLTSFALDVLGKADIQVRAVLLKWGISDICTKGLKKKKKKKLKMYLLLIGKDLTTLVSNVSQVSLFLLFTNVIRFPDKFSLSWDDKKDSPTLFLVRGWKKKKYKKERENFMLHTKHFKS